MDKELLNIIYEREDNYSITEAQLNTANTVFIAIIANIRLDYSGNPDISTDVLFNLLRVYNGYAVDKKINELKGIVEEEQNND